MSNHASSAAGSGPSSNLNETKRDGSWTAAARLVARWLDRRERVDELLETLGNSLHGAERARCQHLVFGVIRHAGRLEAAIGKLVAHPPRFATRAVLFVAGFELIEARADAAAVTDAGEKEKLVGGKIAKIVHHAVEQTKKLASPAEAKLVNAVVRKLAAALAGEAPGKLAAANVLAEYFSHPEWLVKRWLAEFGAETTRALLEWNQQPAKVYARWRGAEDVKDLAWLKATPWPGFFEIEPGQWTKVEPLLKSGKIYLQDPATRLAVEALKPEETEIVLDACAAPGGKSLLIADTMKRGKVIAIDLPGARIERLKENLSRVPETVGVALVQANVMEGVTGMLKEHGLPTMFHAVLLDVPCSNTGVMRHRVDVKWRLQEGDFQKHLVQQRQLLAAAARLVVPGGRLVYSTCSVDVAENEDVVKEFLADRHERWTLEASTLSRPWETGHDGAGVFLLRRSKKQPAD